MYGHPGIPALGVKSDSKPNTYEILCRVLGRDQAVTVKLLRNF
jgi:hypothetical protein